MHADRTSAAPIGGCVGGESTSIRECPAGIQPYPRAELAAAPTVTFPGFEHPDLQAAFRAPGEDLRSFLNHPVTMKRS
jgi:hypothetical protein